jgi:hypothetical protein
VTSNGSRTSGRELVLIYLIALLVFGYFAGPPEDGNNYSRLGLVWALAVEHRFAIDTTQLGGDWHDFSSEDRSFYASHYYSDKAIGSSLIGAVMWTPVHGVMRWVGAGDESRVFRATATFLGVSVLCACLAPLIYGFVTTIAGGQTAFMVTLAIMLGTPVVKYGGAYYGHVQAGLFLFAAFLIWFHARRRQHISYVQAFASCALLGFMMVTEYPTALLALILGGYMLFVIRRLRRLADWRLYAVGAAGGFLALSPMLYYNIRVYGHVFTTGYQHEAASEFAAAHANGLSGIGLPDPAVMMAMTIHPLMGIFWQSPVLLLAAAGWRAIRTEYRGEFLLSLTAIVAYVIFMSGYYDWSGGQAYAPRHLVPLFPLFAIPLAFLPRRWRAIGWCLTGLSIAQHLVATAAQWGGLSDMVYSTLDESNFPMVFTSTIWNVCWPNLRAGLFLENRGALFLLSGFASLLPLLFVEMVLAILLLRTVAARQRLTQPA